MEQFSEKYQMELSHIILERSCHFNKYSCPFVASSLEVVKLICDMFHIGGEDSYSNAAHPSVFAPIVFDSEVFVEVGILYNIKHCLQTIKYLLRPYFTDIKTNLCH